MSPFDYITPGKRFNSTENTKNKTVDVHGNLIFQNGFDDGHDDLLQEERAKYRALESELKEKQSEIEQMKLQLDKTQTLLNNATKNFESLKSSYVSLSCERDTAVRNYEVLKNTDLHRKLKLEQDKVFCLERDLQLTNDKLRSQCKYLSQVGFSHGVVRQYVF